jgi:transcriptional regulator with AAA-type ATPase domain
MCLLNTVVAGSIRLRSRDPGVHGIGGNTHPSTELRRGSSASDTTYVAIASDQLVGRGEELAFLRQRLAAARSGSGRLVLVCGPAGIGKTRLVEELVVEGHDVPVG